jgi:dimethylhistidine N-methyltransferase
MDDKSTPVVVMDFEPATAVFYRDVVEGLSEDEKRLSCKYFYDRRGSQLFDKICQLDEYYLTRCELEIMRQFSPEMAAQIGAGVMLVEYGSGSSLKTRLLLDHLENPAAYVPVDISRRHLQQSAEDLAASYPHIEVLPVCADFTAGFDLPTPKITPTHSAVYFPGSTIGNFQPQDAAELLDNIAPLCGTGGGLLIGIDLKKDVDTLEAAYNDAQGVTAEFNLNLLHRMNRELGANFLVEQFRHSSVYNASRGRIETYLISECEQEVSVGEHSFKFSNGEGICTEYSHKYTIEEFQAHAAEAGLTLHRHWTDSQQKVAVLHFVVLT